MASGITNIDNVFSRNNRKQGLSKQKSIRQTGGFLDEIGSQLDGSEDEDYLKDGGEIMQPILPHEIRILD